MRGNDLRFTLSFHETGVTVELSERTANITVSFKGHQITLH